MSAAPSIHLLKQCGVALKRRLVERGHEVKLTWCHEAIAAGFGFRTYASMLANGGPETSDHYEEDTANRFLSIVAPKDIDIPRADLIEAIREAIALTPAGQERYQPAA